MLALLLSAALLADAPEVDAPACPICSGEGTLIDEKTGKEVLCQECNGSGKRPNYSGIRDNIDARITKRIENRKKIIEAVDNVTATPKAAIGWICGGSLVALVLVCLTAITCAVLRRKRQP